MPPQPAIREPRPPAFDPRSTVAPPAPASAADRAFPCTPRTHGSASRRLRVVRHQRYASLHPLSLNWSGGRAEHLSARRRRRVRLRKSELLDPIANLIAVDTQ